MRFRQPSSWSMPICVSSMPMKPRMRCWPKVIRSRASEAFSRCACAQRSRRSPTRWPRPASTSTDRKARLRDAASHADGDPAVLHVLPLKHGDLRLSLRPTATAAVFVAPATLPVHAPEQALAALYDLTPSEAKVFSLIASGMSLASIAARVGIRHSTAKTHLQRLFAKTGAGRQSRVDQAGGFARHVRVGPP